MFNFVDIQFIEVFIITGFYSIILADVPDAPTNITVVDITRSTVTLEWDGPRHDGGSRIQGYYIEKRQGSWSRWVRVGKTLILDNTVTITNLVEGNEYDFRIVAVNEAGDGRPSESSGLIRMRDPYGEWEDIHLFILSLNFVFIGYQSIQSNKN